MKKIILNDWNNISKIVKNSKYEDIKTKIKEISVNIDNYPKEKIQFDIIIKLCQILLDFTNKDLKNLNFNILNKSLTLESLHNEIQISCLIEFISKNKNQNEIYLIQWVQIMQHLINDNVFKLINENNLKNILKIIISIISENNDKLNIQNLYSDFIIQYFYNFFNFLKNNYKSIEIQKYENILNTILKELTYYLLDCIKFKNYNENIAIFIYEIITDFFLKFNDIIKDFELLNKFVLNDFNNFVIQNLNDLNIYINNNKIYNFLKFLLFLVNELLKINEDFSNFEIIIKIWEKQKKNKKLASIIKLFFSSILDNEILNKTALNIIVQENINWVDFIIFNETYNKIKINKNIKLINSNTYWNSSNSNISINNKTNNNNNLKDNEVSYFNFVKEYYFIDIFLIEKIINWINLNIEIKNDLNKFLESIFITIVNIPLLTKNNELLNYKNTLIQKLIQNNSHLNYSNNNIFIINYIKIEIQKNYQLNNFNVIFFSLFTLILNITYCLNENLNQKCWEYILEIIFNFDKINFNNINKEIKEDYYIIESSIKKFNEDIIYNFNNETIDKILLALIDFIIEKEIQKSNFFELNSIIFFKNCFLNLYKKFDNYYETILYKLFQEMLLKNKSDNFEKWLENIINNTIINFEDILIWIEIFNKIFINNNKIVKNIKINLICKIVFKFTSKIDNWEEILINLKDSILSIDKNLFSDKIYKIIFTINSSYLNKFNQDEVFQFFNFLKIVIQEKILKNTLIYNSIEIILNIIDIIFSKENINFEFFYEILEFLNTLQKDYNNNIRNSAFYIFSNSIITYFNKINLDLWEKIFFNLFFKIFDWIYEVYINLLRDKDINNNYYKDTPDHVTDIKTGFYENKDIHNNLIEHEKIKNIEKQWEETIKTLINCFDNLLKKFINLNFEINNLFYDKIFEKVIYFFRMNNKEIFYDANFIILQILNLPEIYFNYNKKIIILEEILNLIKKDINQGKAINSITEFLFKDGFKKFINNKESLKIILDIYLEIYLIKIKSSDFSTFNFTIEKKCISFFKNIINESEFLIENDLYLIIDNFLKNMLTIKYYQKKFFDWINNIIEESIKEINIINNGKIKILSNFFIYYFKEIYTNYEQITNNVNNYDESLKKLILLLKSIFHSYLINENEIIYNNIIELINFFEINFIIFNKNNNKKLIEFEFNLIDILEEYSFKLKKNELFKIILIFIKKIDFVEDLNLANYKDKIDAFIIKLENLIDFINNKDNSKIDFINGSIIKFNENKKKLYKDSNYKNNFENEIYEILFKINKIDVNQEELDKIPNLNNNIIIPKNKLLYYFIQNINEVKEKCNLENIKLLNLIIDIQNLLININ